jgi:osmotically-inducible protein OsmY
MSVEATPDRIAVWHHAVSASDDHLRCGIEDELRSDPEVSDTEITVTVAGDVVTLTGVVRTASERAKVLAAVRRFAGMHPVHDMIAMRHSNEGNELRRDVDEAIRRSFHRTADIDAANVGVVCESGRVWLSGRVQSVAARTSAENAAWAIPGVKEIDNDIRVGSYDPKLGGEIDTDD